MPFSRYQIRNEFSLADPELYKAADKDDPEALLEGVAMAGLVGVLRQLGDLAEFAAEIFHGLHEEVMVTAARGHGLLERVQQLEADFPSIERAFLSQTGHSAFFSSSGIGWHPNLKTEQNLITRGDLPRFVMDSYEECRGPPRLFLLDKFDVNGAGACLKRYTDPSFYKVEASSFEMANAEAQRNKKIRKTKKKGSRWKNGETPEVFQPSHVKLHQLLLEERVQNGASEVATRRVNLKKREIKFPFDTESGKGYMEKLLTSPPQDKLVHEVPIARFAPTVTSGAPPQETLEITMINESPNEPEILEEEEEVEEKHVSNDHISDGYDESDDGVSEVENYVDALATMESEIETDAEFRPNSDDPSVKQETDSNSGSASDNESSSNHKKITSFSYSDSTSDNVSPHGINIDPPPAFAITEIPFRPRVQEAVFEEKEISSKESDSSEVLSTKRTEDIEIDPEDIIAHSPTIEDPNPSKSSAVDNEDHNSNSTLVISNVEGQSIETSSLLKEELTDDFVESKKSDLVEAAVLYTSEEDEKEEETEVNDINRGNNNLPNFEDEKETESVNSETNKDNFVPDTNESKDVSTDEYRDLERREMEFVNSEGNDDFVPDMDESKDLSTHVNREMESFNSGTKDDFVPDMDESKDLSTHENREMESFNSGTKDDFVPDMNESNDVSSHEDRELEGRETESVNSEGKDIFVPESKVVSTHEDIELEGREMETVNLEGKGVFVPEIKDVSSDEEREMEGVNSEGKDVFAPDRNGSKDELSSQEDREYEGRETESVNSEGKDVFVPDMIKSKDEVSSNEDRELEGREIEAFNSEGKDAFVPKMNENVDENGADNTSANLKEEISQGESLLVTEKTDENVDETVKQVDEIEEEEQEAVEERVEQPHMEESLEKKTVDSIENYGSEEEEVVEGVEVRSSEFGSLPVSEEASVMLPQYPLVPDLNLLPQVSLEEMPPLPPLPPMQWRMGKLPNASSLLPPSKPDDIQHGINSIFPPPFPPSLHTNLTQSNDYQETPLNFTPTHSTLHIDEEKEVKSETLTPVLPTESSLHTQEKEVKLKSDNENVGVEIIRPLTTSSLPEVDEESERPNGIRPMKIQRPRTPLIDAVAAHDITKLRKVSERPMPPTPKEEERDTLLEQIRAKSLKLKPAVQTRPSIQGPSTNLRVAAILEKANAIRQAFAGSDDDDDEDDDSWSDS